IIILLQFEWIFFMPNLSTLNRLIRFAVLSITLLSAAGLQVAQGESLGPIKDTNEMLVRAANKKPNKTSKPLPNETNAPRCAPCACPLCDVFETLTPPKEKLPANKSDAPPCPGCRKTF